MHNISDDKGIIVSEEEIKVLTKELRSLIENDPKNAMEELKKNPKYVLVLSRVRRELMEEKKDVGFEKLLETKVNDLFNLEDKSKTVNLALTIELLIEKWRLDFQENRFDVYHELILSNITNLSKVIDDSDTSIEARISREMLKDFNKRVIQIQMYERQKARDAFSIISPLFMELIEKALEENPTGKKIPQTWSSLLSIACLSPATAIEFRGKFSQLLMEQLSKKFKNLPEQAKYGVAAWFSQLEQNMKAIEEVLVDPPSDNALEQIDKNQEENGSTYDPQDFQ
jgi:hypothetical protein